MSSKRRGQDGGGDKKRPRAVRQKHLYLVLDDWNKGFTIHKIDAGSFCSGSNRHDEGFLPKSPALRLDMPQHVGMFFAAMDCKIFIFMNQRCALVYDTETAVVAVGPHAPTQMRCGSGIVAPAGGTLYALSYRFLDKQQHSLEAMSWDSTQLDELQRPTTGGWSWKTLPAPPPTFSPNQLIISYAVHPDGCTIFMTTAYRDRPGLHVGTFSFNTKNSVWKWHGEWALPFIGQGYFDTELDQWVGLRKDGYICSCPVASRTRSLTRIMQLDWQMAKEKLFRKDPERHMSASHSVIREGEDMKYPLGDQNSCAIHMTMFGLKHNYKRELHTTNLQSSRSYIVSRHKSYFSPEAF
ncbi:hypothetical protein BS78_01G312500 [Paspalum vaginatum]|nr:hypothetical protein BS78_01G312500 [Paspalum vaginatum]